MAYIGSPAAPTVATVSDGTVTSAKLADDAVTSAKLDTNIAVDGNLTVDTNTLYVDSTNNRVGIGTSSPSGLLDIEGATATQYINATSGNANTLYQLAGTTTGSIEIGGGNSFYITANNASGNMIFRTGGANERMRIDSSGRVTMPYQPWFFADLTTNWTGWNPGNATAPQYFDRVVGNAASNFNTSTGVFTAPVTGIYGFWASCWAGSNIDQLWGLYNGGRIQSFQVSAAGQVNIVGSFLYRMNANDTMGFKAFGVGSSGTIISSNLHTFFQGYLIG